MADGITQMHVVELKKDPAANTEFVICVGDSTRWGTARKLTFLAPAGTHKIGDKVQVTVAHEPKETE